MDTAARLVITSAPRHPEGLVLVLHGGGSRQDSVAVSPTQLSVLRMVPIARRIARAGRRRLTVVRLLNSARGWGTRHTPVDDVTLGAGRARRAVRRAADLPGGPLPGWPGRAPRR